MQHRTVTIVGIFLFLCGIIFLTCFYGPLRRVYVSSVRVEGASATTEIGALWETAGVRGRTAVLLTRHLNSEESPLDEVNVKFADLAMKHGIVRTIYHVVPDSAWQGISENLSKRENVRITSSGYVMIKPEGRVHIQPLSQFKATDEKTLVVIEPRVWSAEEKEHISRLLGTGALKSDLVVIIRGSLSDAAHYRTLLGTTVK